MIRNKQKRQEVVARRKQLIQLIKKKAKLRRKKEEEQSPEKKDLRLKTNVPKTLENTRELDETVVALDDEEVQADEEQDELASYFQQGVEPKIVVTTSPRASGAMYDFAEEFCTIFPHATFVKRQLGYDIKDIVKFSSERGYTDLMILNEHRKRPDGLTVVHLPDGPTLHFKLTNYVKGEDIHVSPPLLLDDEVLISVC